METIINFINNKQKKNPQPPYYITRMLEIYIEERKKKSMISSCMLVCSCVLGIVIDNVLYCDQKISFYENIISGMCGLFGGTLLKYFFDRSYSGQLKNKLCSYKDKLIIHVSKSDMKKLFNVNISGKVIAKCTFNKFMIDKTKYVDIKVVDDTNKVVFDSDNQY